jgi:hypothetical protein
MSSSIYKNFAHRLAGAYAIKCDSDKSASKTDSRNVTGIKFINGSDVSCAADKTTGFNKDDTAPLLTKNDMNTIAAKFNFIISTAEKKGWNSATLHGMLSNYADVADATWQCYDRDGNLLDAPCPQPGDSVYASVTTMALASSNTLAYKGPLILSNDNEALAKLYDMEADRFMKIGAAKTYFSILEPNGIVNLENTAGEPKGFKLFVVTSIKTALGVFCSLIVSTCISAGTALFGGFVAGPIIALITLLVALAVVVTVMFVQYLMYHTPTQRMISIQPAKCGAA